MGSTEKAKIRFFCHLSPKSSITIIALDENAWLIFQGCDFGKKHPVIIKFRIKYAEICGISAK